MNIFFIITILSILLFLFISIIIKIGYIIYISMIVKRLFDIIQIMNRLLSDIKSRLHTTNKLLIDIKLKLNQNHIKK